MTIRFTLIHLPSLPGQGGRSHQQDGDRAGVSQLSWQTEIAHRIDVA
jgi:hypothetical protein